LIRRGLLLAAFLLLALAAPAAAESITATSGSITATLNYKATAAPMELQNLTVSRAGAVVYDQMINSKDCAGSCYLGGDPKDTFALQIHDLDADGEPEIVASIYTGGAHCCSIARVLFWDATGGTYKSKDIFFGDPGYEIKDLSADGRPEFVTHDYRFAYRFTAYVFSGLPIRILDWDHGKIVDITKQFPARIKSDAKRWHKLYRKGIKNGKLKRDYDIRGFVAAWAADEYRLGHDNTVRKVLYKASRRDWLRNGTFGGRSDRKFVTDLLKFLDRTGYR
jgi:hypothetical protein